MSKDFKYLVLIIILIPALVLSIIYKSLFKMYSQEDEEIKTMTTTKIITTTVTPTKEYKIKINKNNEVQELNLEDYIIGVVAGEMPATFNEEALKAQAVVSRTYAMYMEEQNQTLEVTTDDQVYITEEEMKTKWLDKYEEYHTKITNCVKETQNKVMKINNKLFKSYYFAMSNGYTEDSSAVFGETNIESVSSPWDNDSLNKFTVETTFTESDLKTKLNLESINNIEILSRDKTNRVEKIKVNEKIYTGIEFRKLLTLRSTDFTIKQDNNNYIIITKGYGHGVGMSQYGANGMAEENKTYEEILKYYYQNIEITNI